MELRLVDELVSVLLGVAGAATSAAGLSTSIHSPVREGVRPVTRYASLLNLDERICSLNNRFFSASFNLSFSFATSFSLALRALVAGSSFAGCSGAFLLMTTTPSGMSSSSDTVGSMRIFGWRNFLMNAGVAAAREDRFWDDELFDRGVFGPDSEDTEDAGEDDTSGGTMVRQGRPVEAHVRTDGRGWWSGATTEKIKIKSVGKGTWQQINPVACESHLSKVRTLSNRWTRPSPPSGHNGPLSDHASKSLQAFGKLQRCRALQRRTMDSAPDDADLYTRANVMRRRYPYANPLFERSPNEPAFEAL